MRMFSTQLNCWLTFEQYEAICANLPNVKKEDGMWFGGWPIYKYNNEDQIPITFDMEY